MFKTHEDCKIFIINNDTTFENQNVVNYWSNLKLHKKYTLAPELGELKEVVTINGVVDIFLEEKIEMILAVDEAVYFSIDLNQTELHASVEFIERQLQFRKEISSQPLIILILGSQQDVKDFKECLTRFTWSSNGIHERYCHRFHLLGCATDVLCSLPTHDFEKCVVYGEKPNEQRRLYIDEREYNQIQDAGIKTLLNNIVMPVSFLHNLESRIEVYNLLKNLLAIFANNARELFISEYLLNDNGSKRISEALMSELLDIYEADNSDLKYGHLASYLLRIKEFGCNVAQLLPLQSKTNLYQLYKELNYVLRARIVSYNLDNVDKIELIDYALELLRNLVIS